MQFHVGGGDGSASRGISSDESSGAVAISIVRNVDDGSAGGSVSGLGKVNMFPQASVLAVLCENPDSVPVCHRNSAAGFGPTFMPGVIPTYGELNIRLASSGVHQGDIVDGKVV